MRPPYFRVRFLNKTYPTALMAARYVRGMLTALRRGGELRVTVRRNLNGSVTIVTVVDESIADIDTKYRLP